MILGNKIIKKSGIGPYSIVLYQYAGTMFTTYTLPEVGAQSHSIIVIHNGVNTTSDYSSVYTMQARFSGNGLRLVSFSWGTSVYEIETYANGQYIYNQRTWTGSTSSLSSKIDYADEDAQRFEHRFSFSNNIMYYSFRDWATNHVAATAVLQDANGHQFTFQFRKN